MAGSKLDLELLYSCLQLSNATVLARNEKPGARFSTFVNGPQLSSRIILLPSKQIDTVPQRGLFIEVGRRDPGCRRHGVEVDSLGRIAKQCGDRVVDPAASGFSTPLCARL